MKKRRNQVKSLNAPLKADDIMNVSDEEEVLEFDEDDGMSDNVNTSELKEFISKLKVSEQRNKEKLTKAKWTEKNKRSSEVSSSAIRSPANKLGVSGATSRKHSSSEIQHSEVSSTTQVDGIQRHKSGNLSHKQKSHTAGARLGGENVLLSQKKTKAGLLLGKLNSSKKARHDAVNKGTASEKSGLHQFKPRTSLLIKPGTNNMDNQISSDDIGKPPNSLIKELEDLAFKISANESEVYAQQKDRRKKSEGGWLKKVVTSGTLADKVAALTLQVQESPAHNMNSLDTLIAMATKKGRRENSQAIESLKELFLVNILPDARHLIAFEQRPLEKLATLTSGNKDAFDRMLLSWYTESQLKAKYLTFIKAIEVLTFDTVPSSKKSAIDTIYKMLSTKPEQEQLLLSIVVNKMGDRDHKVASKCAYLLTKLVAYNNHPKMKPAVIREVEGLLYRPNISPRAQYYAVCFLSQILLSRAESDLANKLIAIHLSLFKIYIQKGEVDRKMMGSLLAGVNRAFPYARVDQGQINSLVNDLYRLVHTINFNTSIQALLLLYQVNDATDNSSDRFYTAIYKKLADAGIKNSNKHNLLLNLLFKTITSDTCNDRVKAFIKRLLQVCCHQLPPFICGALFLVSEVLRRNTSLSLNKDISYSQHHVENRSENTMRYHGDENDDNDDDGLEHFTDAPNPDSDTDDTDKQLGDEKRSQQNVVSSWHHKFVQPLGAKTPESARYDPLHRNPRYCHSNLDCVWELQLLANHYHPSVTLFASSILKGEPVSYDGDPLRDFTLIRFLDRFAFKNPKRSTSDSGSGATLRLRDYKPRGLRALPLSSTTYLQTAARDVPVEEKFLYNYLKRQGAKTTTSGDSDNESISDDEFDAYLESLNMKDKLRDTLDFASEMGQGKKKGGKDDDNSDDSVEDLSDEDMDFDEEEIKTMMGDDSDDDNDDGIDDVKEEDIAFSDDDGDDDDDKAVKKQSRKHKLSGDAVAMTGGKKAKKDMSHLFAAADEFASVLDDNTSMVTDTIGTSAMSNQDKASAKQLAWEDKQQKWLNDGDWKRKRVLDKQKGSFKPMRTAKPKIPNRAKQNVKPHILKRKIVKEKKRK